MSVAELSAPLGQWFIKENILKKIIAIALLMASGIVAAHSGGTDDNGCHTNRKTGYYHCH